MDHSIYAYLNRRSTQQLLELWYYYLGTDKEYDQTIFRMVTEILAKRGEFPTLYEENLFWRTTWRKIGIVLSLLGITCRCGGTGRHPRLKIWWKETFVPVRSRSAAPIKKQTQKGLLFYSVKVAGSNPYKCRCPSFVKEQLYWLSEINNLSSVHLPGFPSM